MKGKYMGPGSFSSVDGFDTGKLVTEAYHTALEHTTRTTQRELARRGVHVTMLEAGRLVEQRISTEGIGALGENFVAIAERAEKMHAESGGQPVIYGGASMSGETAHNALAGAVGIKEPNR